MDTQIQVDGTQATRRVRRRVLGTSIVTSIVMTLVVLFANVASVAAAAPAPLNLQGSSCNFTIRSGQYNGCVTELQIELNLIGHYGLVQDGSFGPKTLNAVVAFQSSHSCTRDGLVGPQTKTALQAAMAALAPKPATPTAAAQTAAARRARLVQVVNAEADRVPTVVEGSARQAEYAAFGGWSSSSAWCAMFASWSVAQAGATTYRSASVGDWVTSARNSQNGVYQVSSPLPGDLVAFDWNGDGDFLQSSAADPSDGRHIAIVTDVSVFSSTGQFTTVEGNTSGTLGDGVYRKTRKTGSSYNVLFIRFS